MGHQVHQKQEQEEVVDRLLAIAGVKAVILYGSAVRPGHDDPGDIDIIVIADAEAARPRVLATADRLTHETGRPVSVSTYTFDSFATRIAEVPSFGMHLRDEAAVFGERETVGRIRSVLASAELSPEAIQREYMELARRLRRLAHHNAGQLATALGRTYGIGRAACILRLLEEGTHIYDTNRAFTEMSTRHPELARWIEAISRTRPFYEALEGRIPAEELDWENLEELFRSSSEAARELIASGTH